MFIKESLCIIVAVAGVLCTKNNMRLEINNPSFQTTHISIQLNAVITLLYIRQICQASEQVQPETRCR